jgi:hypothetical protein
MYLQSILHIYVYIKLGISNLKIEKKVLINPCGLVACPLLPYKHGDGEWLYINICICVYKCVQIYVYIYIYIYVYRYISICIYMNIHIFLYIYLNIYIIGVWLHHTKVSYFPDPIEPIKISLGLKSNHRTNFQAAIDEIMVCICILIYVYVYIYVHLYIYIHIYRYIYVYI